MWEEACASWKDEEANKGPGSSQGWARTSLSQAQTNTSTLNSHHLFLTPVDKRKTETDTILPSLFKGKSMWLFWPNLKDAFPQACFQSEVQTPSCVFQAQQNRSQPQAPNSCLLSLLHPALACWTPSCSSKTPRPRHHKTSPSKHFLSLWPLHIHALLPSGVSAQKGLLDYRGLHSTL